MSVREERNGQKQNHKDLLVIRKTGIILKAIWSQELVEEVGIII